MNKLPHHKYWHLKIVITSNYSTNLAGRLNRKGNKICLGDSVTSDAKIKMGEQTLAQKMEKSHEIKIYKQINK